MGKSKQKQLIIMCGAAGSGKSTWVKNHFALFPGYTKVVSRDQIRFSILKDDEDYFAHEKEVYNKFIEEIKDGLENCDVTIADATHLNRSSRNKLLNALGSSLKGVEVNIIVMDTCLAKCIDQNKKREGRAFVPEDAINRMYASFEMPTLEEGFDKIFIYRNIGNKTTYEIIRKEN